MRVAAPPVHNFQTLGAAGCPLM